MDLHRLGFLLMAASMVCVLATLATVRLKRERDAVFRAVLIVCCGSAVVLLTTAILLVSG